MQHRFSALLSCTLGAVIAALTLNGCSSSSGSVTRVGASGSYGTGPGHTRPMPQSGKVDLSGVKSVPIHYERTDGRGCNRNYTVLGKNYEVWNGMDSYIEEGIASWYGPTFNGNKTSMGEIYNQKGISAAHKNVPLPSYLKVTNLKNGKKLVVRVNDRGPFVGDRILDLSEGAARYLGVIGPGTAKIRLEYLNIARDGSVKNAEGSPNSAASSEYQGPLKSNSDTPISSSDSFQTEGGFTGKSGWVNPDGWISFDNAPVNRAPKVSTNNTAVNYSQAGNSASAQGYYVQMAATSDPSKAQEICSMMAKRLNTGVKVQTVNGVSRVLAGPFTSEAQARSMAEKARAQGASDSFIKKF